MTGLFIFGLMLAMIALSPKFWELVNWAPKEDESSDSNLVRRIIRLILAFIGTVLIAGNFPGVPENLAYPGWFFFGLVAMYVWLGKRWTDVYPFSMEDVRDDHDVQVVIAWIRIIAMILAALGIGIGMQAPDAPPAPTEPVAVEQVVEQTPTEVPAELPATEPTS